MRNLLGGLTGALALNLLHETYRRIDAKAPRVDVVGGEALSKTIKFFGGDPPQGNKLYLTTLGADIVSNALYYSLIGQGGTKNIIPRGIVFGVAAGIGALTLPKPLGLSNAPVTKTPRTKVLTVTWYLAGAVIAALTMRTLKS
jgi:hypothetical protein